MHLYRVCELKEIGRLIGNVSFFLLRYQRQMEINPYSRLMQYLLLFIIMSICTVQMNGEDLRIVRMRWRSCELLRATAHYISIRL